MRHSNIRATTGPYADVDTAVEDAVKGRRNTQRNSQPAEGPTPVQRESGKAGGNRLPAEPRLAHLLG
jgi:hypothetical protein